MRRKCFVKYCESRPGNRLERIIKFTLGSEGVDWNQPDLVNIIMKFWFA
jgi:hypothetical protein